MIQSIKAIKPPVKTEMIATAKVCATTSFGFNHVMFLNSAHSPLNQPVFFAFTASSTCFPSVILFLYAGYETYRTYNISWSPFFPDVLFYLSSYCNYDSCTPYILV